MSIELTEGMHTGEFLLSEAQGQLSRENVTVVVPASTTLPAGSVLAVDGDNYVPLSEALVDADAGLSILYAPLTNDDDESAEVAAVVIDCFAEVRGADLDWNSLGAAVQEAAIALLRAQGIKVRDYTPSGS